MKKHINVILVVAIVGVVVTMLLTKDHFTAVNPLPLNNDQKIENHVQEKRDNVDIAVDAFYLAVKEYEEAVDLRTLYINGI